MPFAPLIFNPTKRDEILAIPGVRLRQKCVQAPDNALPVVVELDPSARPVRRDAPRGPGAAKHALPYLQPWVPAFLTDYQRAGITFALGAPGGSALLVWAAGSGKTLAAIIWALSSPARIITVTKAAVRGQWRSEIERFTRWPESAPKVPTTLEGETTYLISLDAHWLLLSYDALPFWIDEIERWADGFQLRPSVVFDESQHAKSYRRWDGVEQADGHVKFNLKGNRAGAAYRLSRLAGRRLATTATPIRDRVRDLWSQLDLIHPDEWGPYWKAWAPRYAAAREGAFGGIDDRGFSNGVELRKRLDVVCHRVSKAEANRSLPPLRRLVTYVRAAEQSRPTAGMAAELRAAAKLGGTALLEAALLDAASRKRTRVLDLVDEAVRSNEKVVVFTGRRADCDALLTAVERAHPAMLVVGGHGGDAVKDRDVARVVYMNAQPPAVLIGTTDAWGEGLNLQDTDLLLVTMLPYTPGQVIQLEGRVSRLGQKRPVLVHYLIAEGTIDEEVAGKLLAKLPAVENIIDSDEVRGFSRTLSGVDDEDLLAQIIAKIGEKK